MAINSISSNVGNKQVNVNEQQSQRITGKSNTGSSQNNATNVSADTVNLTGTASKLRGLEQQLTELPVVDGQRVDAIKREIANGSYKIDAAKVADKMIEFESTISERLI